MVHAEDAMIALHEWYEAVRPHNAGTAQCDRPAIPSRAPNVTHYAFLSGGFSRVDVEEDSGSGEAAAADANVKAILAGVKLVQWETMIVRGAIATIEYLNEGMSVSPKKYAGYDRVWSYAFSIDQFEVPPFEICSTAIHGMVKMKAFRPPDAL